MIKYRLIAVEGGDGSGKATQSKLLGEHLREKGYDVLEQDFPQYGEFSSLFIERYLNGEYGDADDVPADLAGLAYAINRLAATPRLKNHLRKDNACTVLDRSTASNMAHQGTKFQTEAERHRYYAETIHLEYELLGIPKPDVCIVLLVPSAISQANVDKKAERSYTKMKRDVHEASSDHLERAKHNYQELCTLYPDYFMPVDCMEADGTTQRSIADIQQEIRRLISE